MSAPDPLVLDRLAEATARLVRGVDAVPDDAWRGPSALPGWSRAHVAAHLALNAEGLAGALDGLAQGERRAMYVSAEARDRDIEDLAAADAAAVRTRLLAGSGRLAETITALPPHAWDGEVERVPGGQVFPVAAVPAMRWREVEVHHCDLDAGYARAAWPVEFAEHLVASLAARPGGPAGFAVEADDAPLRVELGEASDVVVRGAAADLGWWLSGRPVEDGTLSSSSGVLPQIGAW